MSEISITPHVDRCGAPDIIAEVDPLGAKLIIVDGADRAEARPTPQGALLLGEWLIGWAIRSGARPTEDPR